MKALLIGLLFCVSVITQAQVETDTIFTVDEYGNRIDTLIYFTGDSMYIDLNDLIDSFYYEIPKAKPSEIGISLQDFFDYEQECYNDSIPEDWEWVELVSISDNGGINFYKVKKTPYKHTEPTFEGFIAYLRKWYKNYMK